MLQNNTHTVQSAAKLICKEPRKWDIISREKTWNRGQSSDPTHWNNQIRIFKPLLLVSNEIICDIKEKTLVMNTKQGFLEKRENTQENQMEILELKNKTLFYCIHI